MDASFSQNPKRALTIWEIASTASKNAMIAASTPATGTATDEPALTTAPLPPADAAAFAAPADAWLTAACRAFAAAP